MHAYLVQCTECRSTGSPYEQMKTLKTGKFCNKRMMVNVSHVPNSLV